MDALKVLTIIALTLFIMILLGAMATTSCLGGAAIGTYYANQDASKDASLIEAIQHANSSEPESMMVY